MRKPRKQLEGARESPRPLAQDDFFAPAENLDFARFQTECPGYPHGLRIPAAKDLGNRHAKSIYVAYLRVEALVALDSRLAPFVKED